MSKYYKAYRKTSFYPDLYYLNVTDEDLEKEIKEKKLLDVIEINKEEWDTAYSNWVKDRIIFPDKTIIGLDTGIRFVTSL